MWGKCEVWELWWWRARGGLSFSGLTVYSDYSYEYHCEKKEMVCEEWTMDMRRRFVRWRLDEVARKE